MLNVLCDRPSFTSIQKYGFHTGIKYPYLSALIHIYSAGISYDSSTCQIPTHVSLPTPHMVTMPPSTMPVALCVSDNIHVNCGLYMVR